MDRKQFEDLADMWGGHLSHWPDSVRAEADAFLHREPSALAILSEASELDNLLSTALLADGGELLEHRIMRSFPKPAFDADWRRPAMAAAAALVIGLAGGYAGGGFVPVQAGDATSLDYADAFDGLTEDWSSWEWSDA
ncbi:MAG: hypothetical protein COW29_01905 [Rhodobacterales bacterium CG15_BIG_FIL_POST_REV_8_21_14_020_59_13]|nr:MAG: hypothetical protein COW29_01905 [Rhodobacterales bacterium CG15_BIG_FIL_POST_REV_8_21_14_020_59_13]